MGGLGGVTVATTRFGGRVADQLSSVEALAQKGKKEKKKHSSTHLLTSLDRRTSFTVNAKPS